MVLAVARPHSEMHVTIPSPLKDDPPPPYPGPTSVTNMAYFPNDDMLPNAPAYTLFPTNEPTPPPPYSNVVSLPSVTNQSPSASPSAPPLTPTPARTQHAPDPDPDPESGAESCAETGADPPDESGNETAPLVNKHAGNTQK